MPKTKPNDLRVLGTKKAEGYRFIDKDPDIDMVVAAIGNSGLSAEKIEALTIAIGRKVSAGTILGWTYGKTKRPQNYTLTSVMMALGYEREWSLNGVALVMPVVNVVQMPVPVAPEATPAAEVYQWA